MRGSTVGHIGPLVALEDLEKIPGQVAFLSQPLTRGAML